MRTRQPLRVAVQVDEPGRDHTTRGIEDDAPTQVGAHGRDARTLDREPPRHVETLAGVPTRAPRATTTHSAAASRRLSCPAMSGASDDPVTFPSGSRQAGDQPAPNGSGHVDHDDRDGVRRLLCRQGQCCAVGHDDDHLDSDQLGAEVSNKVGRPQATHHGIQRERPAPRCSAMHATLHGMES